MIACTESWNGAIQSIFNNNKWRRSETANQLIFNNTVSPYDSYIITAPTANEITVSIPLNEVAYKKTFTMTPDAFNTILDNIIAYLKMHVDYYENKLWI